MVCAMLPAAAAADEFPKARTWDDSLFTDVSTGDWYYENVKSAYELGLMAGYGDGTFRPVGNITVAQTIAVAARIHAIATTGKETFVQGTPWYQVYVDYALANGILDQARTDYNTPITRALFSVILSKALPPEALEAINDVPEDAIPDVDAADSYHDAV